MVVEGCKVYRHVKNEIEYNSLNKGVVYGLVKRRKSTFILIE